VGDGDRLAGRGVVPGDQAGVRWAWLRRVRIFGHGGPGRRRAFFAGLGDQPAGSSGGGGESRA